MADNTYRWEEVSIGRKAFWVSGVAVLMLVAILVVVHGREVLGISVRETALRGDLFQLRQEIDRYTSDKGKRPRSLDQLVSGGYMVAIPDDPTTDHRDWGLTRGDYPQDLNDDGQGLLDIHSSSSAIGSNGKAYNTW